MGKSKFLGIKVYRRQDVLHIKCLRFVTYKMLSVQVSLIIVQLSKLKLDPTFFRKN